MTKRTACQANRKSHNHFAILIILSIISCSSFAAPQSSTTLLVEQPPHSQQWFFTLPEHNQWEFLGLPEHIIVPSTARMSLTSKHTYISHQFRHQGSNYDLLYTQGEHSGIGELYSQGQHFFFTVNQQRFEVINVNQHASQYGLYENDVVLPDNEVLNTEALLRQANDVQSQADPVVVDLLLIYTPNIANQYPGDMAETLMQHLTAKANQAFVNSTINMQLRLVGTELVNYTKPSGLTALADMAGALDFDNSTLTDPSLDELADLREQLGADLVAMIRTHDLNEREVCGVARFPTTDNDLLINVSNVGISGGSNCFNTFTHEIGHNFGAGHQQFNGESVGMLAFSGALIAEGQYNTVMSSIGTGNDNRNYKLPVFSNPSNICGGDQCGDANVADNARTINAFAQQNAALRAQVVPGTVTPPAQTDPDSDGDGVHDSDDHFPYHSNETADDDNDGVGNNADAFIDDPTESVDTDGDGIGNNTDNDDDGDGIRDNEDDLPLDGRDSVDADNDKLGQSQDALDNDFQEQFDADGDGIGDLADNDDDNDGVPDYYASPTLAQSQLIVASQGTDQLLAFDAETGEFIQVVTSVGTGGLSFRSELINTPEQHLFFIAFSDVMQFDRQRERLRVAIPRTRLSTNFPVHLALSSNSTLYVNNGLGNSYIEGYSLASSGNEFTSASSSSQVFRDIELVNNSLAYIVSRDTNQVLRFNPQQSNSAMTVLINQGLNKPEHLVVAENGHILVSNAADNSISRFSSEGQSLGVFIQPGSGGLSEISCMEYGPDQHLYVCSKDTHQIMRFDGETGAFLDVTIASGAAGLNQPVSLAFVSAPLDSLPYDPNHDSDNDGVLNPDDDLPLDPTETTDTDNDGIGNNADEDDDGDGMPDTFEEANGFDPLDPSDASEDADSDGISNVNEYLNGTDPLVADSPPVVLPPPQQNDSGGVFSGVWYLLLVIAIRWRRRT